jgi:hypothetical protein
MEKVSYFEKECFWYDLSNHYTFKQVRVIIPLTTSGFLAFGEMLEMVPNDGDNLLPTNLI